MQILVNVKYNSLDLTKDQSEELRTTFFELVKNDDRRQGVVIKWKELFFVLESIVIDLNENKKIFTLTQISTTRKLETPKGIYV